MPVVRTSSSDAEGEFTLAGGSLDEQDIYRRSFWRQGFNNPAIGDDAAPTLVDHPVEFGLERQQISDLLFHLCTVFASDGVNCRAGLPAIVGEREKRPDLVEREAEVTCPTDEAQSVKMIRLIGPVVAFGA